jgi:hypothetical protein
MSKIFNLKPVINKKNGQMNFSLSKKNMPDSLKKALKANGQAKVLKFKFEGVEF